MAVVALRHKSQRITVAADAMNIMRLKMYNWHPKDLADECDVSVSCIYAIRNGKTKWPRPHTFFALLEALDLHMLIVDNG